MEFLDNEASQCTKLLSARFLQLFVFYYERRVVQTCLEPFVELGVGLFPVVPVQCYCRIFLR